MCDHANLFPQTLSAGNVLGHPTADQCLQCAEHSSTGRRSTQPNVQQGGQGKSQCQKSPCGFAHKDMFTHTLRPSPWPARSYTGRGRRHWAKVMFYNEKRRACLCARVWCELYLCLNYKRICSHTRLNLPPGQRGAIPEGDGGTGPRPCFKEKRGAHLGT